MTISWSQFEAADMRVGVVADARELPEARQPASELRVDLGPLGVKQSSARLIQRYRPEELIGRQVVSVVNFPPRQMATSSPGCS